VRIAEQLADAQSPARLQDARKLGQCCILVRNLAADGDEV